MDTVHPTIPVAGGNEMEEGCCLHVLLVGFLNILNWPQLKRRCWIRWALGHSSEVFFNVFDDSHEEPPCLEAAYMLETNKGGLLSLYPDFLEVSD